MDRGKKELEQIGAQLSEEEFLKRYFELGRVESDEETLEDIDHENVSVTEQNVLSLESSVVSKKVKPKRRSNLGEFGDNQSIKRKNEAAKRELTSIVNQLTKIDKQLNSGKDDRVSINFSAKFTSFKSERISTFQYPPGAQVKQTLLDLDTTVSVIKNVVKEAVTELVKAPPRNNPDNVISLEVTPTKTSAAIEAFPSPVIGPRLKSRSLCVKNSCSFGKKLKKPVWMKCNYRDQGFGCSYWAHAPCVGYPTINADNAQLLDCWYCPDHTAMAMKLS